MSDVPEYEIRGGADEAVAAAIGALVAHLHETEARLLAQPSRRPRQSPWAMTARPREIPDPLPSHTYDSTTWSASNEAADEV